MWSYIPPEAMSSDVVMISAKSLRASMHLQNNSRFIVPGTWRPKSHSQLFGQLPNSHIEHFEGVVEVQRAVRWRDSMRAVTLVSMSPYARRRQWPSSTEEMMAGKICSIKERLALRCTNTVIGQRGHCLYPSM